MNEHKGIAPGAALLQIQSHKANRKLPVGAQPRRDVFNNETHRFKHQLYRAEDNAPTKSKQRYVIFK
jgi:hypothetical protein